MTYTLSNFSKPQLYVWKIYRSTSMTTTYKKLSFIFSKLSDFPMVDNLVTKFSPYVYITFNRSDIADKIYVFVY